MILAENSACNAICRVCHYKNLDYSAQIVRKQSWAEQQLAPWQSVLRPIVPAPEDDHIGYRAKSWMQAHFANGEVSFGMYRAIRIGGEWEQEFVAWDTCPLHVLPLQKTLTRLRRALAACAHDWLEKSLVGVWFGSPQIVVVCRDLSGLEQVRGLDWQAILDPPFDRVWFHANPQVGKRIFGHWDILPVFGNAAEVMQVHPVRAFRQVAQALLVQARDVAVRALLATEPSLVVDLYCGTGDLARLIPDQTGWLGIELAGEAVKYSQLLRSQGERTHAAFVGTVEHRLRDPQVLRQIESPYALYINPPRSGLSEQAIDSVLSLLRQKPPTAVAYLSCSASSLARDLKHLDQAGYFVESLQPYDFFPQTEHFETLALLRRR